MFVAIMLIATVAIVACAAAAWFTRSVFPLLGTIFLLPVANIYVGGIGFFVGLLATTIISNASETDLRHARWFFGLWAAWLLWTTIGLFSIEATWRQLLQAIEFLFYGVLAWQVTTICKTDSQLFVRILISGILGCVALSLIATLAFVVSGAEWPSGILGRNEAAFVIVALGLIPALYLLARPTWLVRIPPMRPQLLSAIVLFVFTAALLEARAAMATAALLIVYTLAFGVLRRRAVGAAAVGAVLGLSGLVAGLASGVLIQSADLSASFSNLERLSLLQASFRLFLERPILGWGWGSIDALIPVVPETVLSYPHPHNSLAHFAVELGIFGVVLFVLLAFRPLARAISLSKRGFQSEALFCISASACIFLLGMTGVVFYGASRAIPAVILLAMVEALPLQSFVRIDDEEPSIESPANSQ